MLFDQNVWTYKTEKIMKIERRLLEYQSDEDLKCLTLCLHLLGVISYVMADVLES